MILLKGLEEKWVRGDTFEGIGRGSEMYGLILTMVTMYVEVMETVRNILIILKHFLRHF